MKKRLGSAPANLRRKGDQSRSEPSGFASSALNDALQERRLHPHDANNLAVPGWHARCHLASSVEIAAFHPAHYRVPGDGAHKARAGAPPRQSARFPPRRIGSSQPRAHDVAPQTPAALVNGLTEKRLSLSQFKDPSSPSHVVPLSARVGSPRDCRIPSSRLSNMPVRPASPRKLSPDKYFAAHKGRNPDSSLDANVDANGDERPAIATEDSNVTASQLDRPFSLPAVPCFDQDFLPAVPCLDQEPSVVEPNSIVDSQYCDISTISCSAPSETHEASVFDPISPTVFDGVVSSVIVTPASCQANVSSSASPAPRPYSRKEVLPVGIRRKQPPPRRQVQAAAAVPIDRMRLPPQDCDVMSLSVCGQVSESDVKSHLPAAAAVPIERMRLPPHDCDAMSLSVCGQVCESDLQSQVSSVCTVSHMSSECTEVVHHIIPTIIVHPPTDGYCERERRHTFDNGDASLIGASSTICITASRDIIVSEPADAHREHERKNSFDYWDAPLIDEASSIVAQ